MRRCVRWRMVDRLPARSCLRVVCRDSSLRLVPRGTGASAEESSRPRRAYCPGAPSTAPST